MDLSVPTLTGLTTVGGAAILVNIIVQLLKTTANLSDALMARFGELIAIVTGIVVVVVASLVVAPLGAAGIVQDVLTGIFAGLTAIGIYNTVTSQTGSTTP